MGVNFPLTLMGD